MSYSALRFSARASCAMGALLWVLCSASPVLAASGVTAPAPDIGFVDLNGDTRISYDEFVHSLAIKALAGMNADKTGPRAQRSASAPAGAVGPLDLTLHFSRIDTNRDGRISLDEMKRAIGQSDATKKLFKRLDTNGDGSLDASELDRIRTVPQIVIEF